MNYDLLEPDYYCKTPNYNASNIATKKGVCWHHMAGNLTGEGCVNVWKSREASAHYAVETSGRVCQMVDDWNNAWHCGNNWGNAHLISIEVADDTSQPWHSSDKAVETLAHLTAAICVKYGFGRPEWGKNVYGHSDFSATACPAQFAVGGSQHDYALKRAQEWYDAMKNGGSVSEPASTNTPQPTTSDIPTLKYRVRVNGEWLAEMHDLTDTGGTSDNFAGILGSPIEYLAINMPGWYQVKTVNNGWLPKVTGYNINDLEYGCAGDGSNITAIRCYYETQNPNSTGWLAIEYQAHTNGTWLANMHDLTDTGGTSDDFAGNGNVIDGFRAKLVRV